MQGRCAKYLPIVFWILAVPAAAHTLFVKPGSFFVPVDEAVDIPLLNGTFVQNENKVGISRMTGDTIVHPDGSRQEIDDDQWRHDDDVTTLTATFPASGTYVVGIGTKPMKARIAPDNFNFYLRYEGLDDQARERTQVGEADIGVAERYAKFAKAILQAGDNRTDNFDVILGHPAEIVPLQNPYDLSAGDTFRARILRDGQPLAEELIYATHEGFYELSEEGIYSEAVRVRSDERGEIAFQISSSGRWYVRFIDLQRTGDSEHWYSGLLVALGAEEPRIPYESLWATLTFEVR